ncbi:MAG: biosynthetic-type acetolactate synthase large subunit [Opitutaceae bacterium]|jgi:acetolactate synthase-1/2/3 large subunit|nr:biosynthetic-type acetolactate synthase large subunit [Opitutaceae bacterium]
MKKTAANRTAARQAAATPVARELKGADIVVRCLEREGVEVVFTYPGGSALEINQALTRTRKIRTILPRHEQGGSFAASGYARASGKVGVCTATSGPGATNLVSAIADAFMDSVPLVAITGQVFQKFIGKTAFQETDFFGMTLPVVKHSYLVLDVRDLPRVFKEAFALARSGRPGPVVIDIPKDVQQARAVPEFPDAITLSNPVLANTPRATDADLDALLRLLEKSKRPVLYTGGGIIAANASAELRKFAEKTRVPVTTTLMGLGAFPENHPLSLRWLGMHGLAAANWAVDQCDLLIALGARFDDRVTGDTARFAPRATIVHLDIDASELNKNKPADLPVAADVLDALRRLNARLAAGKCRLPDTREWLSQTDAWKADFPFRYETGPHIRPQEVIETLHRLTKGDATIVTGVGQHQMWAAQFYPLTAPRRFISSLGLGAMGYGYPAALGAKLAQPKAQVIDIDGDGSFLMNIQELATAAVEKIAAKVIILNNQHLGMVVQWEDRFYNGNRGNTLLTRPENLGHAGNPSGLYPDFVKIAEGFGVKARRVLDRADLVPALNELLAHDGPCVLDVITDNTQHVLPMIPGGASVADMILE